MSIKVGGYNYMRTGIQITRIGFFTFILGMFSIQAHAQLGPDEKAYYDNYQNILKIMEKGMEDAPETGDPSLDFLYEMIPHHQAAVSMLDNCRKHNNYSTKTGYRNAKTFKDYRIKSKAKERLTKTLIYEYF